MDTIERALTDPENQPSQWGTVSIDDPNWVVSQWRPIADLNRATDNTYLVRVENVGGTGVGPGWIDKGYFDGERWTSDDNILIERGPWKITAFAEWPKIRAQ